MTKKTSWSSKEKAAQEQSIAARAQQHLGDLARSLVGGSKLVPYGVVQRGRVLDPARRRAVDLANPPMIKYVKIVFRKPVKDETKYTPDAAEVFAAFMALVSSHMKALEHHEGEFWESLRQMAPAKVCIEITQFTKTKGYTSTILERVVPRGAP